MNLYDKESEKAVLGAIKRDSAVIDDINLSQDDFYFVEHRKIYSVMLDLINKGVLIDDIVLSEKLPDKTSYISMLNFPTAANVQYYADIVREYSRKRKLIEIMDIMKNSIHKDTKEIIENMEFGLSRLYVERSEYMEMKEVLFKVINRIEEVRKGGSIGIKSGFVDLDRFIGGFSSGEISVVAARASIGKTAFSICVIRNMLLNGFKVGFFSLEMNAISIGQRFLSVDSMVSHSDIKSGNVEIYSRMQKITDSCDRLYKTSLLLDDTPNIRLVELKSKARKMKREGVQIIFIDYLGLINYRVNMPTHERVGEIIKSLKGLARELDIPIVIMSQINRQGEGKIPSLSELSQSGEIEQHADIVMFLHRKREDKDTVLKVGKNRNGAVGIVNLYFLSDYVKFVEKNT